MEKIKYLVIDKIEKEYQFIMIIKSLEQKGYEKWNRCKYKLKFKVNNDGIIKSLYTNNNDRTIGFYRRNYAEIVHKLKQDNVEYEVIPAAVYIKRLTLEIIPKDIFIW